jgi:hypothetical protein
MDAGAGSVTPISLVQPVAPSAADVIGPAGHWVQVPRDPQIPPQTMDPAAIVDPVHDRLIVYSGTSPWVPVELWQMTLAGTLSWTPLVASGPHPPTRIDGAVAYDPVRARMILYGGRNGSVDVDGVWALDLAHDPPVWSQLVPAGTAPAGRSHHTMTYDPVRDRMLVFGGVHMATGERFQDVWALDLAIDPEWQLLAPSGTAPPARYGHAAVYDPVRDRLLIHDGVNGFDPYYDLWALSLSGTPAWSSVTQSIGGPQPRRYHAMCYDPIHDGLVIYGGDPNSGDDLADTWTFSFATATWTGFPGAGPGPHTLLACAYDAARARLIIETSETAPSTWAFSLDPAAWTGLLPPADRQSPEARALHAAVRDPLRDRMLVLGGVGVDRSTWALDLTDTPAWSRVDAGGDAPLTFDHTLVFDPPRDRMLVLGGTSIGMDSPPVLSFGGSPTWSLLHPAGPAPVDRDGTTAIYDPVRDRVLLFGGYIPNMIGGGTGLNDVWQLSLGSSPAWTMLTPLGTKPVGRGYHAMVYDAAGDRLVVIGGLPTDNSGLGAVPLRDVWQLTLSGTPAWQKLSPLGIPPVFLDAPAIAMDAFRHRALVYVARGTADSVFALSLDVPVSWGYLAPAGGPPASRRWTVGAFDPDDDRMLIFAGQGSVGALDDSWELRFESPIVGVDPPRVLRSRALAGAVPNPSSGAMRIDFTLADRSPATIELFDPAGRRIAYREVGSEGAGTHTWLVGEAAELPPGLYLIRLRGPAGDLVARAVHIR